MILRALFIGILIVVTAHVASPQTERFWSAYETPGDLIRMI
jgi:fucose 4-O-acetylase-like acetyltransferase